jgi:hypothetical protein
MPEVGSLMPQIILRNSHNGTSKIQLSLGIFRLVCSNGLVVADSQFAQIKRKHMGVDREEILKVIYDATKEFPTIWNKVHEYKSINLTSGQRLDFATAVVEYNWGKDSVISPDALLKSRRHEDEAEDLFTTYNIIQENIIKGGAVYVHPHKNKLRKTRAIKNIYKDFNINSQVWLMMQAFATTKSFNF